MRSFSPLLLALTLGACGDSANGAAPAPEVDMAPLMGRFDASSDAASALGDVSVERGGLLFDNGVTLFTRALSPRRGGDRIADDGRTYAAAALGRSDLSIDLRRVTQQVIKRGAVGLCGEAVPTYVALAYEAGAASVTMIVFSGADAPGPQASDSAICATFVYDAPNGARTSQGIVLR